MNLSVPIFFLYRGFSTVHAIAVAVASFYLIELSDTFHEGYSDELIISRRSTLSDTTLGVSGCGKSLPFMV